MKTVEVSGIVMCADGVVGDAGSMGKVTDELQHQQAGAEEESTGCAGCSQLVWPLKQGGQGVKVYDHHQNGRWVYHYLFFQCDQSIWNKKKFKLKILNHNVILKIDCVYSLYKIPYRIPYS